MIKLVQNFDMIRNFEHVMNDVSFDELLTPFLPRGLFRSALARWLASVHSPRDPWSSAEALRHTGPRRWTTVYVPGGGGVRIARAAEAGWLAAMSSCALGWALEPS